MQLCDQILNYHFTLQPSLELPQDVEWLFPYNDPETRQCMEQFYNMYYNDNVPRTLIMGINPGRFGGGITGIPFTDPIRLEMLGIQNTFSKKQELSSVFIYEMIDAFGGSQSFYHQFYISSLSPLGLLKNGVNYNYYDDPVLAKWIEPFIISHINAQMKMGLNPSQVLCLGQGKNYQYLSKLNDQHGWWNRVVPLPHPRWIMQYKLKDKQQFIQDYIAAMQ